MTIQPLIGILRNTRLPSSKPPRRPAVSLGIGDQVASSRCWAVGGAIRCDVAAQQSLFVVHEASQVHVVIFVVSASTHNSVHFFPQKFNSSTGVYSSMRAPACEKSRNTSAFNAIAILFILFKMIVPSLNVLLVSSCYNSDTFMVKTAIRV